MTYAPSTITALMSYWTTKGGVNLGIVGDTRHIIKGTSYHLGKDYLAAGAYSATLPRDRAGLSNAASAMDLGKLGGSLTGLQKFSVWLVAAVRADPQAYRDIREVIYSPDGQVVRRWDNELKALRVGGDGTGQGDNTHLYHTHISFYRDSEYRPKVALFSAYFEDDIVKRFQVPEGPQQLATLKDGAWLHVYSDLRDDPANIQINPGRALPYIGKHSSTPDVRSVAYEPTTADDNQSSWAMFVRREDITSIAAPPAPEPAPVPSPAAPTTIEPVTVTISQGGKVLNEIDVHPQAVA